MKPFSRPLLVTLQDVPRGPPPPPPLKKGKIRDESSKGKMKPFSRLLLVTLQDVPLPPQGKSRGESWRGFPEVWH